MSWPRFGDLIVIYSALTPLCVMFWHATFALLDHYMAESHTNMLVLGYTVIVVTLLLHETLRYKVQQSNNCN